MIITLQSGADPGPVQRELIARGLWVKKLRGARNAVFLVEPGSAQVDSGALLSIAGVADVAVPQDAHPLVSKQRQATLHDGSSVGPGQPPLLVAGPCGVESPEQIEAIAARLRRVGVRMLRGGAFKPRTSPYSFQGHGLQGLKWMASAARRHQLGVVTEVMAPQQVEPVAEHADMLQIGSRTMQSFSLLAAAGSVQKPILLKRGMAATVSEWLLAGEYCLKHGAPSVIFCERGIRSFDSSTRNVLDLGAVALLAHVHGQPVIVDPSHAAGRRDLLSPLAHAALAAGAHGLMLETHDDPGAALSDGPQALLPADLAQLLAGLNSSPSTLATKVSA